MKAQASQVLKLFKISVRVDPDIKDAKFQSPIYSLILCAVTEMAYKSRHNLGHRLLYRYARCMTDIGCDPKIISDIRIMMIHCDKSNLLGFE